MNTTTMKVFTLKKLVSGLYILGVLIGMKVLYNYFRVKPVQSIAKPTHHHRTANMSFRSLEYCNSFQNIRSGEEGEVHVGYKLELVHVVIRHGARTSIHDIPGLKSPAVSCQVEDFNGNISKILERTKQIWNQKNRTFGFRGWDLHPKRNTCKESELTPLGMKQHIHTGNHLHLKYKDKLNLTNIHVKSTATSRTFESAVAVLYGLLTAENLENVKLFKSGQLSFCSELFGRPCICPGADKYLQLAKHEDSKYERYDIKRLKLFVDLSKILGDDMPDFVFTSYLIDTFMTFTCHNISLPCVNKRTCFTNDHLDRLWEILDRAGVNKARNSENYKKYAHLYLHPLLTEIANRMTDLTKHKQRPESFVLYSGHDITITPLAVVLGIYNGKWPPFASRIVIELYKKVENKINYFIKIFLNGKDVTSLVSFCKEKVSKGFCKLKYFLDFVKGHLRVIGLKSYEMGCSL